MGTARQSRSSESDTVSDTSIAEAQAPGALELDPFAYHPGEASRIAGLGGTAPRVLPEYAFHTPYVEAAPGKARFHVRFEGLRAKTGTLVLRVHMLPTDGSGRVRLVNSEHISFNRLIQRGSEIDIGFEGYADAAFAVVGTVKGETDAEANGLSILLDHPADPSAHLTQAPEARSTAFGNIPLRPAPFLLSTEPARLANPVTQVATEPQLREPVAGSWLARLRPKGSSGVEHWRKVYTLQALRRYGMLEDGAIGLGFEPSPSGLPATLAAMGTRIVAAFPARPGHPLEPELLKKDLATRAPCDPARFETNVAVRLASWRRIPKDLLNFDFLWSARANERLYSVASATEFIEETMSCLRPGGLAVHTMSYDLSPSGRSVPSTDRMLLQQGDVERIALILVSRGHEVAQFKIDAEEPILAPPSHGVARRTMVGIIARKARIAD